MVITAGAKAAEAAQANQVDSSTLDDIAASQDSLDELSETFSEQMSQLHKLQDKFETAVKKQAKMIKSVQAAQRAQAAQRTAQRTARRMGLRNNEDVETSKEQEERETRFAQRFEKLKERVQNRQQMMPSTGGMFVELFLGSINVRFARKSERLNFKREYETTKLRYAAFGVFFCIVCLIFPDYRWLHMMFQLSLSWYYATLAIRENILRVNGSNIRTWWIIHHYLTMMQSVLLLTWPNGASYVRFRNPLHMFGLYNAVLMIFQTRYQMARLYALRSLGMAHEMDVASSDNTQIHWSETMTLLLPLIIFGQLMQGYMAIFLFRLSRSFTNEFQIVLLCFLFFANFTGNVSTTIQVLLHKRAHMDSKGRNTRSYKASLPNNSSNSLTPDVSSSTHAKQI